MGIALNWQSNTAGKEEQPKKAVLPIDSSLVGREVKARFVQPKKAAVSIDVTPVGREVKARFVQC